MRQSSQNRPTKPSSEASAPDELRHLTHIEEGDSVAVASVNINHRSLKYLTKQLEDPAVQARIRAVYGDSWSRLEVDLGKSGHTVSRGVLTLRINQEQELRRFIRPEAARNVPAEKQSLESEFLSTAVETLRVMLLKGLKADAPREDVVKVAGLMRKLEEDPGKAKKIFQPAMRLYERHYMGQSAHDPMMQGSPTKHFYRFVEQCERGPITTDTQIAFRGFMQAFCRSLPPEHLKEKITSSINSASKLFRPCRTPSLEQLVSSLSLRRSALNELTTLALLAESSLVSPLNAVIIKSWHEHYTQFTQTVKNAFFSGLSSHDDTAAENAAGILRTHGLSLATPGTSQYLMTLQLQSDNTVIGAEFSVGRFSRELDIFLEAHRELVKHPITENEALERVERLAAPCFEWLADRANNVGDTVPEDADICARSIAQLALASGGPQEHLFCEITREILDANAYLSDRTMPVQIYCMLASFKKYYELVSNEITALQKHTSLLLGWSLTGALDVIATDITRQISASSPEAPLCEIEALYQRLTNIISLLQRPKTGVIQGQEIRLSARLSTITHFVEFRRFMAHVSGGILAAAAQSLSSMRNLRDEFQDEPEAILLEAKNRERVAARHLLQAAYESVNRLSQYLDDGNLGEAIVLLHELNGTAVRLPRHLRALLNKWLSIHRDTFEELVDTYWKDIVQPQIGTAATYIQKRKEQQRLAEALSSEEESCLTSLIKDVGEIEDAWRAHPNLSSIESSATNLDKLLRDFRNRYDMILSEWRLCPAAHKTLPKRR